MVNYDEEFSALLQNSGHLVPFLDSFFGFLYRRTDFFVAKNGAAEGQSMVGFDEGQAEKILLGVFRRWQNHSDNERRNLEKLQSSNVPPVASEVEVEAESDITCQPIPNVKGMFRNK
jgi:hypothetical protein